MKRLFSLLRVSPAFIVKLSVNPSSVMSPAGPTSLEDQQYMEKLKQLSKYIEPLRRMINKIDKNEGEPLADITTSFRDATAHTCTGSQTEVRGVHLWSSFIDNGTIGDLTL